MFSVKFNEQMLFTPAYFRLTDRDRSVLLSLIALMKKPTVSIMDAEFHLRSKITGSIDSLVKNGFLMRDGDTVWTNPAWIVRDISTGRVHKFRGADPEAPAAPKQRSPKSPRTMEAPAKPAPALSAPPPLPPVESVDDEIVVRDTPGDFEWEWEDDELPTAPAPLVTAEAIASQVVDVQAVSVKGKREENRNKEAPAVVPDWIPPELWTAFLAHRKQIKKPMTEYAKTLMFKKLESAARDGHSPVELLENTISSGWQGIVIPKKGGKVAAQAVEARRSGGVVL